MAIDTAAKRNSAIATRRLPWFRRFAPIPDGSVTQADRQQVAFVYGGIAAATVSVNVICGNALLSDVYEGTAGIRDTYEGVTGLVNVYAGSAGLACCDE